MRAYLRGLRWESRREIDPFGVETRPHRTAGRREGRVAERDGSVRGRDEKGRPAAAAAALVAERDRSVRGRDKRSRSFSSVVTACCGERSIRSGSRHPLGLRDDLRRHGRGEDRSVRGRDRNVPLRLFQTTRRSRREIDPFGVETTATARWGPSTTASRREIDPFGVETRPRACRPAGQPAGRGERSTRSGSRQSLACKLGASVLGRGERSTRSGSRQTTGLPGRSSYRRRGERSTRSGSRHVLVALFANGETRSRKEIDPFGVETRSADRTAAAGGVKSRGERSTRSGSRQSPSTRGHYRSVASRREIDSFWGRDSIEHGLAAMRDLRRGERSIRSGSIPRRTCAGGIGSCVVERDRSVLGRDQPHPRGGEVARHVAERDRSVRGRDAKAGMLGPRSARAAGERSIRSGSRQDAPAGFSRAAPRVAEIDPFWVETWPDPGPDFATSAAGRGERSIRSGSRLQRAVARELPVVVSRREIDPFWVETSW